MLSPGPCTPNEAGICLELVAKAGPKIPMLGVCLGHQTIGQAYGGKVIRAPEPMHGKLSTIRHSGKGLFAGLPDRIEVTRYHSLIVERASLPGRPRGDGRDLRRPDHGPRPQAPSRARLAVPPREHRLRARPRPARQFPRARRASRRGGATARLLDGVRPSGSDTCKLATCSAGVTTRTVRHSPERNPCPPDVLKNIIGKVATGATLTVEEMQSALEIMMSGVATPAQMGAFLMALRVRGETVEEITGAAKLMREKMLKVTAPAGAVDIVGTGGDGHGTFNVSTCASLVAAGAGLKIAKHGNRSVSSISGASDVLTALGVKVDLPPAAVDARDRRGRRRLHVGAAAPLRVEALGADPRRARASAPCSTCSDRSAIRPASSGRSSACSPGTGSSRSRTC